MTDQQTMERVQQEVVSANHDRLYKATLKEVQENKKQKNTSNPSAPSDININGNIEPIKWDPTSPIIILAGFVFHHRNPKQAPETD